MLLATNFDIPEVSIFFNSHLYRGNRTTKVDTGEIDTFDSPNFREWPFLFDLALFALLVIVALLLETVCLFSSPGPLARVGTAISVN